jgi:cobalt-zinc-cadmium efflux system membrane fusion protein
MLNIYSKWIFALLILLMMNSCDTTKQEKTSAAQDNSVSEQLISINARQIKNRNFQFAELKSNSIIEQITAQGKLDVPPENLATISALMGGFIRSAPILPGTLVQKGQVLAIVENLDLIEIQRQYAEFHSRREYLKAETARQKVLSDASASALKAYQQIQSELEIAQAQCSAAEMRLKAIGVNTAQVLKGNFVSVYQILAPIQGYITESKASIGLFVQPTDKLFSIANTTHLHAELSVYEHQAIKLSKGQKVYIQLAGENETIRTGTIYLLGHTVQSDRTISVHVHLDKEDPSLVPGTALSASIHLISGLALSVHRQSIYKEKDQHFLYIVVDSLQNGGFTVKKEKIQLQGQNNEIIYFQSSRELYTGRKYVMRGAQWLSQPAGEE